MGDEGIAAASTSKDTDHESPITAEDVQKNATETALVTTDNDLDSRLRASDDAALASGKLSEAAGINNDSLGPLTTASDELGAATEAPAVDSEAHKGLEMATAVTDAPASDQGVALAATASSTNPQGSSWLNCTQSCCMADKQSEIVVQSQN